MGAALGQPDLPFADKAAPIQATRPQDAEEQLAARVAQQAAVASLGQRALAAPNLDSVLQDAVAVVADTLGVQFAAVLELEPGGAEFRVRAGTGWPAEFVATGRLPHTPRTHSGYTLARGDGRPVVVTNVRAETRFEFSPIIREQGIQSGITVSARRTDPSASSARTTACRAPSARTMRTSCRPSRTRSPRRSAATPRKLSSGRPSSDSACSSSACR